MVRLTIGCRSELTQATRTKDISRTSTASERLPGLARRVIRSMMGRGDRTTTTSSTRSRRLTSLPQSRSLKLAPPKPTESTSGSLTSSQRLATPLIACKASTSIPAIRLCGSASMTATSTTIRNGANGSSAMQMAFCTPLTRKARPVSHRRLGNGSSLRGLTRARIRGRKSSVTSVTDLSR